MLKWQLELKKSCPSLKILTYYGSNKERQMKRQGWTRSNDFHVCITSYQLLIQDMDSFRRKQWSYLILDQAQQISDFHCQPWQNLFNLHCQHRLILIDNLPWTKSSNYVSSLVHFLMSNVFVSFEEYFQWLSKLSNERADQHSILNSDSLMSHLQRILRPLILRRLKIDVNEQLPNKHEHILLCDLSKRQRLFYDRIVQCQSTRDALEHEHYSSMINILMRFKES
jgi:SNF2 family DNA or RNA helicase